MRDAALKGLAVGFFDGVHLGHQAILKDAAAALTFGTHPLAVLDPARAPHLIMTREERLSAIGCPTKVLDFTPDLAAQSPEDFAARFLAGWCVRCGSNWRFGRGGIGDADWLRRHGYAVEVIEPAVYQGEMISSSRIRAALSRGELEDANAMLGRRYAVCGEVMPGKGLGRRLGYPTVNVQPPRELLLPQGVYAVEAAGVKGIANYGCAPTMGAQAWQVPVLEVHFLGDVPSAPPQLRVEFERFIRPERTFASPEELKTQIAADVRAASF